MAGLGFKDFQVGEVLTSADVDGYLMQQTVMRFANSSARGSALGTASGTGVALAEGMVSYLDDVNQVQVFDGSAWRATGAVLQVVQTTKTNQFSTASSTYVDVTGLSVTITPNTTGNKVLLIAQVSMNANSGSGFGAEYEFSGGNSGDYDSDAHASIYRIASGSLSYPSPTTAVYLDSPSTTSAITYKVRIRALGGATAYINQSSDGNWGSGVSSITAMEIAG